jgi:hypothetical protein
MKIRNVVLVAVAAAFSAGLYGAVILTDSTHSDPRGLGAFPTASLVGASSDEVSAPRECRRDANIETACSYN